MIIDGGGAVPFDEARARILEEQQQESQPPFWKRLFLKIFYSPQHLKHVVVADSAEKALRKLERAAGLSRGDLSFNGRSWKCATLLEQGTTYYADSETEKKWKTRGRPGYVAASVFRGDKSGRFFGKVHVSKNCPGVFTEDRCIYCCERS